mgnify:CR=1 FL=1
MPQGLRLINDREGHSQMMNRLMQEIIAYKCLVLWQG